MSFIIQGLGDWIKEDGRSSYVVDIVKVQEALKIMVAKSAERLKRRCEYFIKMWL
jgi:hypothetical protein